MLRIPITVIALCVGLTLVSQDSANAQDQTNSGKFASQQRTPVKLHCVPVRGRWLLCGDAKPFTSFAIGAGFRFVKIDPADRIQIVGDVHTNCKTLSGTTAVPNRIRAEANRLCKDGVLQERAIRELVLPSSDGHSVK